MEHFDYIFKKLRQDKHQPSNRVWEHIHADQEKKRKKRIGFWITSITILALGSIYFLFPGAPVDTKSTEQHAASGIIQKEQPFVKSSVATKAHKLTNEHSIQTSEKVYNVALLNHSNKNNFNAKKTVATNRNKANPITAAKRITEQNNNTASNLSNEEYFKSLDPISSMNNIEEPNNNAITVQESKENTSTSGTKDSVSDIKISQNTDTENKIKVLPKNKEKQPRKKYIQASLVAARTFRRLGVSNDSGIDYKNFRNASEIASDQLGLSIMGGVVLNKKFNLQGGLFYLPQKMSSSYSWQQIKTTQVFDSTHTRAVFDTATSSWRNVTDSFYHPVTTQQPMHSNGDLTFYYLRIPLILNYEMSIKKVIYYIGGGASLNILLSSHGSVKDYNSSNANTQLSLSGLPKNLFGLDMMLRTGAMFNVWKNLDLTVGINGGYNLINAFGKQYPLKQNHFWYGIETGFRWNL